MKMTITSLLTLVLLLQAHDETIINSPINGLISFVPTGEVGTTQRAMPEQDGY